MQQVYGQDGLRLVDRFGVYLSREPILKIVRRYQRPAMLDIGCGYHAKLLHDVQPLISSAVGVDFRVSDAVKAIPQFVFHEQPVEQALDLVRGQQFDVITMISVLEHLWEPQQVLRQCQALLRPGGALVVNVPNWIDKFFLELVAFKLKISSEADGVEDHKMYYSKRDLWPLLVRAGFKPSRIHMRYHKLGLNLFAVATKGHDGGSA